MIGTSYMFQSGPS